MTTALGVLAKAAFRIEGASVSGTGLINSTYPTTPTIADNEEVVLGGRIRYHSCQSPLKKITHLTMIKHCLVEPLQ